MIVCKIGLSTFGEYINGVRYINNRKLFVNSIYKSLRTTSINEKNKPNEIPNKARGMSAGINNKVFRLKETPTTIKIIIFKINGIRKLIEFIIIFSDIFISIGKYASSKMFDEFVIEELIFL